jgi:hypothetical protein
MASVGVISLVEHIYVFSVAGRTALQQKVDHVVGNLTLAKVDVQILHSQLVRP